MDVLYQQLESCIQASNIEGGMTLLNQIKRTFLLTNPPSTTTTATNNLTETTQAVAALELGVLLSIQAEDLDAFGRTVSQIQPYYAAGIIGTPRKLLITGLNLMHLLVDNRLSEFHSELELLTEQEATSPFITFPVGIERQLMVGIYDEVLSMQLPDPFYHLFVEHLLQTVRNSIADCMEVSYKTLTVRQAADIMKLDTVEELLNYVKEERDDWILDGDILTFQPVTASGAHDIPSMEWIQQSLTYATELERII